MSNGKTLRSKILVIDGDLDVRGKIRAALEGVGYRVLEAGDGQSGFDRVLSEKPELVIVDTNAHRLDGFGLAASMRRYGLNHSILMISASQESSSRVRGLRAGADDYLNKPVDFAELVARVDALLRRRRVHPRANRLRLGDIVVDLERRSAFRDGETIPLTKIEYALLWHLAAKLGAPVSRNELLDKVWGYDYYPTTRTVDTHIYRLRKKINDTGKSPRWIRKLYGQGYILDCDIE